VYHHTIRFYNKTVTVTSLYWKLGWKLCYTALIAISTSKNNYCCFVSQTNTDDVGGFLQVEHFFCCCCKVLNLSLWWGIEAITCLPQNRHLSVVSKDEWDTKEGPGKSMKNALYVQWHGKRHLSGWSDIEQQKKSSP